MRKLKKVWMVTIKSEVLHSIYIPAKSAEDARRKVENAFGKDDRDPIHSAISDSLNDIDEVMEREVFEVDPTRVQGA